jgi:hypothetical protein
MLPLKFFNCVKIDHFSTKCPYAKNSNSNEEEVPKEKKKYKKGYKKGDKRKVFNKRLYSREYSASSDEYDDSDNDLERLFFMEMETQKGTPKNGEED